MESVIVRWVLAMVVLAGAAADWRSRKIPNWLTLPAMAAGLSLNATAGNGIRRALLGMLAALGTYFVFFAIGFRGAGDGKLMGAVGAFVGWPHVVTVMMLVALAGGIAAIAMSWQYGMLASVLRSTAALAGDILRLRWRSVKSRSDFRSPGQVRMPHGPVIAAGTLAFLLMSPR